MEITGNQVKDGTIFRRDLNTTQAGEAVIRKAVSSTDIQLTSTGVDAGTGDVTISLTTTGIVAGTYAVATFDNKGRATTGRALQNSDLPLSGVVAGTYTKVTVNDRGLITSGANLSASDLPSGSGSYIQNTGTLQSSSQFNVSGQGKASSFGITSGSFTLTLAVAGLTANRTLTFPNSNGTNNQTLVTDGSGNLSWATLSSGVTSVGLAAPAELTVTNSPVTTTGTLTLAWTSQTLGNANKVFATPNNAAGVPSFRSLVVADIPAHATVHEFGGADQITGQNLSGLRNVDSPTFASLTLNGNQNQLVLGKTTQGGAIGFNRGSDGFMVATVGFETPSTARSFRFSHSTGGGYFTFWLNNGGGATETVRFKSDGEVQLVNGNLLISAGELRMGASVTVINSARAATLTNLTLSGFSAGVLKTNASGVVSAGSLVAADIPNLDASKITTGTMATARLGSGTANATAYLAGNQTWVQMPKRRYLIQFVLGESITNYSDRYFYSWRDSGSTQDDSERSGHPNGLNFGNSCSPIRVPFTGTIVSAGLSLRAAGVNSGTVTYPCQYKAQLFRVGWATEHDASVNGGVPVDINFSITSANPVGSYNTNVNTNYDSTQTVSIAVTQGQKLALKFKAGGGSSGIAVQFNAIVTLVIEEA